MMKINRRDFLKAIGLGSTATAAACSADPISWDPMVPFEHIYPYVQQPEQIIPGVPSLITTTCTQCSAACGLVAKNREGRIINIEGNTKHPFSKGKLCFRGQTGLQETYSPDRIAKPRKGNSDITWDVALQEVAAASTGKVAWIGTPRSGASHAIVNQFVSSALKGSVLYWDELNSDSLRVATKQAFGIDGLPTFALAKAKTIVNFGMDFLNSQGTVELAQGWSDSRDPNNTENGGEVSKMFSIGPRIGVSNANTDIHISCKVGTEQHVGLAIAKKLADKNGYAGSASAVLASVDVAKMLGDSEANPGLVDKLVDALAAGASVVLPGGTEVAQGTEVAVASLLINEVAGNIGNTVQFGAHHNTQNHATAQDVLSAIQNADTVFLDNVDVVFAFSTKADVANMLASKKVIMFTNEANDSITANTIVIPSGTSLETWGDAEARIGFYSLRQASMRPANNNEIMATEDVLLKVAQSKGLQVEVAQPVLVEEAVDGMTPVVAPTVETTTVENTEEATTQPPVTADVLPAFDSPDFHSYLQAWWKAVVFPKYQSAGGSKLFREFWIDMLQTGFYASAVDAVQAGWVQTSFATTTTSTTGSGEFDLVVFPHPYVGAGRHANRPWAREVPDVLSGFSWGTWIEIHPDDAERLSLRKDKGVTITTALGTLNVGWFGSPGVRKGTIAVVMGGGKTNSGRYAKYGANPLALVEHTFDSAGAVSYTNSKVSVAASSEKNAPNPQNGLIKSDTLTKNSRNVNFTTSIDDFKKAELTERGSVVPEHHLPETSMAERAKKTKNRFYVEGNKGNTPTLTDMYPEPDHPTYRFAMAIDLNRCTGCNACNAACYAENNIPVVGPDQVRMSRSMGWIRLSRYWEGTDVQETGIADVRFQPVMCQQCSHAPCEGVCPVLATYHNLDGINAMIYNRCVGTRYCANNCPYSARRFNFHTFRWPESFNLMLNPSVSTREMGVMEKCTFCIQRIKEFKDTWRDEAGFAAEGTASTASQETYKRISACAAACPSDAISFGNLNDPNSDVSKLFADRRAYRMLDELNTKPGVSYLTRIVHTESKMHHGGHGAAHGAGHETGHGAHTEEHGEDHGTKPDHKPEGHKEDHGAEHGSGH